MILSYKELQYTVHCMAGRWWFSFQNNDSLLLTVWEWAPSWKKPLSGARQSYCTMTTTIVCHDDSLTRRGRDLRVRAGVVRLTCPSRTQVSHRSIGLLTHFEGVRDRRFTTSAVPWINSVGAESLSRSCWILISFDAWQMEMSATWLQAFKLILCTLIISEPLTTKQHASQPFVPIHDSIASLYHTTFFGFLFEIFRISVPYR